MSTAGRRRGERGFTLMELLVVLGLAAFLMTMGATLFLGAGQGTAFRQAVSDVTALVSTVRDASSTTPATLVLDPEAGEVSARTARPVQELHFDPIPQEDGDFDVHNGIGGYDCTFNPANIDPTGGRVGGGLKLGPNETVDCGNYSPYDVTDGFSVVLYVKPRTRATGTLVDKGQAFTISLAGPTRLVVRIGVDSKAGPEVVERSVTIPAVPAGEWLGIHVSYDRQTLTTATDHGYGPVRRDHYSETRPLRPDANANLVIGGRSFDGTIDDFTFSAILSNEPIRMPADVVLLGEPRMIQFVGGRLDEAAHPINETITMQYQTRVNTLVIGRSGLVQDLIDTTTGADDLPDTGADQRFDKAE